MYKASDGKAFGNTEMGKHYDKTRSSKQLAEPETEKSGTREQSDRPIEDIVAEHGPAHHVEIHRNEEDGKHSVHSHHGSYKHVSDGHDLKSAHIHSHKAMGGDGNIGAQPFAGQETPGEEQAEAAAIPGMRG